GQTRQSNTARTVGNVGSHPPSRIWASSQFRKRLPSTLVQGSSGESRLTLSPVSRPGDKGTGWENRSSAVARRRTAVSSSLSLGGLSVDLETLDDLRGYFFRLSIAHIHVSIG